MKRTMVQMQDRYLEAVVGGSRKIKDLHHSYSMKKKHRVIITDPPSSPRFTLLEHSELAEKCKAI